MPNTVEEVFEYYFSLKLVEPVELTSVTFFKWTNPGHFSFYFWSF